MDVITSITSQCEQAPMTIYDAYDKYCHANYALNRPIVSKAYFEKCAMENIHAVTGYLEM